MTTPERADLWAPDLRALDELERENKGCHACPLRAGCLQVVVSDGNPAADLLIIGEGPGGDEDRTGRPFVGRAGQLLDRILAGVGLERHDTYITNIVKCRPPANRAPTPPEIQTCTELWLDRQLALLRPKVIVTMGNTPTRHLLGTAQGITRLRGQWHPYRLPSGAMAALMPMFHPAYLLRNDTRVKGGPKSLTWADIQEVAGVLRGERPFPVPATPPEGQSPLF
ncbi:uracil-DNA glycosylase [Deinococcus piscis]|uniref:Type-4 uracil-DNA glycosylase n=1 Tax=Deinococcus piscis TaxID=394230 RepID=A0ABQ3JWB4_9DEIO|nr:uracil-DNA glycosylase [Deinococcus piscis]GHF92883.1 uracil-DNA glycosylase [Deinococcus piscis]